MPWDPEGPQLLKELRAWLEESEATPDYLALRKDEAVVVVVISGPIASGKSALSRAVAAHLEEAHGAAAAVIDLDLVYEMLDAQRGPKDDERLWRQARRIAGGLGSLLLSEGRAVVVEGGDFANDEALAEFKEALPEDAEMRVVLLDVDFETALQRARSDDSRGVSKDRAFLSRHYAEFSADWSERDVLKLDTGSGSLAESARTVVEWVTLVR